jgi:hypothetical protein
LYLNFEGTRLQKGFQRTQSFILCSAEATVPPSVMSISDRDLIVDRVSEHFKKAGVALEIRTSAPTSGDYTTIHIGGSYGGLGCTESPSTLGIAPFDERNANRNDIGFVFDGFQKDPGVIADTVAHEAGHTYGLDHTVNTKDLMHGTAVGDDLAFAISQIVNSTEMQDGPATLRRNIAALPGFADPNAPGDATNGGSTPGTNPGSGTNPGTPPGGAGGNLFSGITVLGNLLGQLQPGQLIDVTKLLPGFAALIPGIVPGVVPGAPTNPFTGGNFSSVLTALPGLPQINTLISMAAPGLSGQVPGALPGALPGLDPATIATLAALAAFGGYGSIPAALLGGQTAMDPMIALLIQMLGSNMAGTGPLPSPASVAPQLPPYMNAYNLSGTGSPADLVSAMMMQAAFINSSYTGSTQQALITGLMIAASQAYAQM